MVHHNFYMLQPCFLGQTVYPWASCHLFLGGKIRIFACEIRMLRRRKSHVADFLWVAPQLRQTSLFAGYTSPSVAILLVVVSIRCSLFELNPLCWVSFHGKASIFGPSVLGKSMHSPCLLVRSYFFHDISTMFPIVSVFSHSFSDEMPMCPMFCRGFPTTFTRPWDLQRSSGPSSEKRCNESRS